MPKYTFDHVHLASPDPVKTAEYYEKMFGAKKLVQAIPNGPTKVSVEIGNTTILIAGKRGGDAEKPSLDHFGIKTDNLEKAVPELKAKGVVFTQEITQIRPDFKISFLKTPDGVSIELQEGSF
jgi:lactoylglutathione lyase